MSNIDKQAVAGDVNAKTYYIHPAAFGSTRNPGYGHVAVVKAEDFEKLRAKLEAAEKRIAELEAREVKLPELCVGVVQGGHAVMVPYAAGHWFNKTAILEMLADSGINIAAAGKGE